MAEDPRQVLIHLHSGTENKKPTTGDLKIGEIAVNHHDLSGATLFTKTSDGNIAEFKSQWYVDNAVSGATADLQGKIDALSAGTEAEVTRIDEDIEELSGATQAIEGNLSELSAQTQVIESVANSALQEVKVTGETGDYVTLAVTEKDSDETQTLSVSFTAGAIDSTMTIDTDGILTTASVDEIKDYIDSEVEKASADVTALSGAVEAFSAEVYTNYATKEEVATASANSITSANSYTDTEIETLSGNVETAIEAAKTEAISTSSAYTDSQIEALSGEVNTLIAGLDATATTVTESNDIITLKTSVVETDGKIAAGEDAIELAKVAKTGKAEDVSVVSGGNLTSQNVQDALEELQGDIDAMALGMRYRGAWSDSISDAKVGDTYTYTGSTPATILGKNVEEGDTIIVSAENSGVPSSIVVIERNLDGAVTATENLSEGNLVIGKGNKTIATSGLTYGDLMNAIDSATTALQTVNSGTPHDYVTVTVSEKQNNNQNIEVAVDTVAITAATANAQGLADAYDVKQNITELSGNVVDYVKTVSGYIETTINTKDAENVKSVTENETQNAYVQINVTGDDQNPELAASVVIGDFDSDLTVTTSGLVTTDYVDEIKDYVDDKVAQATQDLSDLSGATVALSAATVEIESNLGDLSGVTEEVISDLAELSGATEDLSGATVQIENDLAVLSGATISEIDVICNINGVSGTTVSATVENNKATIDLSNLSIDCGEY